jgi:hypothetical protein
VLRRTPVFAFQPRLIWPYRKSFEPFGGLQAAILAARQGKGPHHIVEMDGIEGLYTADPDYLPPRLKDILITYVAFDILAFDGKVRCQLCVGML